MNNEEFDTMFDPLKRHVALSELEKNQMRGSLQAFINDHPARVPFSMRFRAGITELFSSSGSTRTRRWGSVALASMLVLILGPSTSFAAETSLPGNPLYPIKINVEEPIQGAFATTPQ